MSPLPGSSVGLVLAALFGGIAAPFRALATSARRIGPKRESRRTSSAAREQRRRFA